MLQTRIHSKAEKNYKFSIYDPEGEEIAEIIATDTVKQNFIINTESGYTIQKPNGFKSNKVESK